MRSGSTDLGDFKHMRLILSPEQPEYAGLLLSEGAASLAPKSRVEAAPRADLTFSTDLLATFEPRPAELLDSNSSPFRTAQAPRISKANPA